MSVKTLGGLALEGQNFRREKPLLLAAYLALKGPQPRRSLAELFYEDASDPLNSLAVSIGKLRKLGVLEADDTHGWLLADCDVLLLQNAVKQKRFEEACQCYTGKFAAGVSESTLSPDLCNWVLETRDALARQTYSAWLARAEQKAGIGQFQNAAELVLSGLEVLGIEELEPEQLARPHWLLTAAEHPMHSEIERLANEYGIGLHRDPATSRGRLRQMQIGREHELERLSSLKIGEWAWLGGASGMGKTTLLRELERQSDWRYLPARSGLPYATLEPLVDCEGHEDTILKRLLLQEQHLLLDDWHLFDVESQQIISRLRLLRPAIKVVIADSKPAPFKTELQLGLHPLEPSALTPHEGAYDATHGIPVLLGSWLRGEPLIEALEERLHHISAQAQQVYAALCLLEQPDREHVRFALEIGANQFSNAWTTLLEMGLIEISGRLRAAELARLWLQKQPQLEAELALKLARHLPSNQAFVLYQHAKGLWTDQDLPLVQAAYLSWAQELLDRGYPSRALEALGDAPINHEVLLLRARAMETLGQYNKALEVVQRIPILEARALHAKLLWRIGDVEQARELATQALGGSMFARAEAFHTLGHIERGNGSFHSAFQNYQRSSSIWQGLGQRQFQAHSLNYMAICMNELGENPTEHLNKAMQLGEGNPMLEACVHVNKGMYEWRSGNLEDAMNEFLVTTKIEINHETTQPIAMAWMNAGVIYHLNANIDVARSSYHRALQLADRMGDRYLRGLLMCNLAELNDDVSAWEDAILLLEKGGWTEEAARQKPQLEAFKHRSG